LKKIDPISVSSVNLKEVKNMKNEIKMGANAQDAAEKTNYILDVTIADEQEIKQMPIEKRKVYNKIYNELLEFADEINEDLNGLTYICNSEKEAIKTGLKILRILKQIYPGRSDLVDFIHICCENDQIAFFSDLLAYTTVLGGD